MKDNCWNKCFLCLTNFGSISSSCGGKKSQGRQNPSVLIKYLLGTWDQNENDSLLQRIRRLQLQRPSSSSASSSEGLIKFCDKCQDSARRISHLQMELEVIEMKIVDILWSMRKTVIGNSSGHHDGTSGLSWEEFTKERQEVLETLYAFQAAVVEKSKESVHVPLVYIEKFTGRKNLRTNRACTAVTAEGDNFLIKTEPEAYPDPVEVEDILSNLGDNFDSFDYDDDHHHHPATATPNVLFNEGLGDYDEQEERMDEHNNEVNIGESAAPTLPKIDLLARRPKPSTKFKSKNKKTKISKKKKEKEEKSPRKRGRLPKNPEFSDGARQALPHDLQPLPHHDHPVIKEEQTEFLSLISEQDATLDTIIKEENSPDGKRKARSAAQTAVKRIADVKKLSRASFQYRPRKVPNKARKNKEIDTKTKSTPEESSSTSTSPQYPHPSNPAKILLNPVLKTGKIFKTPKQRRGRKSKSKNAPPATPRIKRYFECELCPYKSKITFQFEHHLRDHETPGVVNHICPHCTNPQCQFSQKQSFDYHMNSHTGFNKMACDLCPKFIGPFAIMEHLEGHHHVEKVFQCCCCSYHCGTREGYLKHTRYHSTAALVCDVCSKKFRRRQTMLDHMHDEHKLLEKVKCDVANCDKEFFETLTLEAHKRLHTEAFVCSECNLQFPTTRRLRDHQIHKHSREKPHQCSECSETFIDKPTLLSHLIKAHGAAKLKCPYCPKEYASQGFLTSHINLHEGIAFPCEKCDKVFGDRRQLKRHQVVHKTTKDFICEVLPPVFCTLLGRLGVASLAVGCDLIHRWCCYNDDRCFCCHLVQSDNAGLAFPPPLPRVCVLFHEFSRLQLDTGGSNKEMERSQGFWRIRVSWHLRQRSRVDDCLLPSEQHVENLHLPAASAPQGGGQFKLVGSHQTLQC